MRAHACADAALGVVRSRYVRRPCLRTPLRYRDRWLAAHIADVTTVCGRVHFRTLASFVGALVHRTCFRATTPHYRNAADRDRTWARSRRSVTRLALGRKL